MYYKFTLLIILVFVLGCPVKAQQSLKGVVLIKENGEPLAFASVKLENPSRGTMTDSLGNFQFDIPPTGNIKLTVSSLGFASRELVVDSYAPSILQIWMEKEGQELEEVIVSTGYQTLSKERATGSFTYVDNRMFNEQVGSDVLSRLEAVANGLTVDRATYSETGITIRGLSTIRGPREPLIVLDNFPYDGDIGNINPNDVENITILKDAAAASIWGTRAGNGVIVITTKKGSRKQKPLIDFNSNIRFAPKPDLSLLRSINSSDYIDVERMLYENGQYDSDISSSSKPALSPVVELLLAQDQGLINEEELTLRLDQLKKQDVRNDYRRYMYRESLDQQYSFGVKGGGNYNTWIASLGYDHNINNLNANYTRYSLRFQNNIEIFKEMELSIGAYYIQSRNITGRPGIGDVSAMNRQLYPYARFADDQGNALSVPKDYRQSYIEQIDGGRLLDWQYYPLDEHLHSQGVADLQNLIVNLGLNYKLPLGVSAEVKYQYGRQYNENNNLRDENSYFSRNLINSFTQFDPVNGAPIYKVPKGAILDRSTGSLVSHNVRGQLSYNQSFGYHRLVLMAGSELRSTSIKTSSDRVFGYRPDILIFGFVDLTTTYPNLVTGRNGLITNNSTLGGKLNRFVSLYGNAAYIYRDRYSLNLSARRDASNLFGVNANDRWNPLWSAGIGWEVSKESSYESDFLPYLKLRATYGFSGNVDQSKAAVTTIRYDLSHSAFTLSPTASFQNYANPELKWEKAGMFNFGVDFSVRNNNVSGSIEYFHKMNNDLLGIELLDYSSGIGATILKNIASTQGNGIDLELHARILGKGAFRWTSIVNLSYYKDKVTKNYLSSTRGSSFVGFNPGLASAEEGRAVYGIYSYPSAGLDPLTGDPQGYMGGELSKDYAVLTGPDVLISDLLYHGSALPVYFGSFGNSFSYKGFALDVRSLYKLGYYYKRESISYSSLYGNLNGHEDFSRRWRKPGDEKHTIVPSMVFPGLGSRDAFYNGSSDVTDKADHIRLQYINASYTIDNKQWNGLPFKVFQVYANVSNVGIVWRANKYNIDPDYGATRNALIPPRVFTIGFKGNF